jgi:hypothetical protein
MFRLPYCISLLVLPSITEGLQVLLEYCRSLLHMLSSSEDVGNVFLRKFFDFYHTIRCHIAIVLFTL